MACKLADVFTLISLYHIVFLCSRKNFEKQNILPHESSKFIPSKGSSVLATPERQ